jgi:hypothetical protein
VNENQYSVLANLPDPGVVNVGEAASVIECDVCDNAVVATKAA